MIKSGRGVISLGSGTTFPPPLVPSWYAIFSVAFFCRWLGDGGSKIGSRGMGPTQIEQRIDDVGTFCFVLFVSSGNSIYLPFTSDSDSASVTGRYC